MIENSIKHSGGVEIRKDISLNKKRDWFSLNGFTGASKHIKNNNIRTYHKDITRQFIIFASVHTDILPVRKME